MSQIYSRRGFTGFAVQQNNERTRVELCCLFESAICMLVSQRQDHFCSRRGSDVCSQSYLRAPVSSSTPFTRWWTLHGTW